MQLTVHLGEQSYPIEIERGILEKASKYIARIFPKGKIMVVSDDSVFALYGEKLLQGLREHYECFQTIIPHGEPSKSFQTLPGIYSSMLEAKMSRSDLVIALGGGVVGDLTGFAAATYMRGVPYVQIPTSLLAQVDSSVGGKTAVDLAEGKNLVGAFYHPKLVLIDPDVLDTLPERYLIDGMGEVIKYGCIKDCQLFHTIRKAGSFEGLKPYMTEIIFRCVDIKRQVVEQDQFDVGERMLLNFGHTLAHAIEQYYHYERESHGEAVAIGMYQITKLSEERGMTKQGCAEQIRDTLKQYGLPTECGIEMKALLAAVKHDKKNLNHCLNLVLLKEIGESFVYPTEAEFFYEAGVI